MLARTIHSYESIDHLQELPHERILAQRRCTKQRVHVQLQGLEPRREKGGVESAPPVLWGQPIIHADPSPTQVLVEVEEVAVAFANAPLWNGIQMIRNERTRSTYVRKIHVDRLIVIVIVIGRHLSAEEADLDEKLHVPLRALVALLHVHIAHLAHVQEPDCCCS